MSVSFSIKEIADIVNGIIVGVDNIIINNVAKIDEACRGDISFIYLPAYEKYFDSTEASVVLVKADFNKSREGVTLIKVDAPDKAFLKIILKYFSPQFDLQGIDSTASIHPSAK